MRQLSVSDRNSAHRKAQRVWAALGALAIVGGPLVVLAPGGVAAAATPPAATCAGTIGAPAALLAGTYSSLSVTGDCVVNSGQVVVTGNVSVAAGAALNAGFANNASGTGPSNINVAGNITVGAGATLILGCEGAHFACFDDPNPSNPTLNSASAVGGSIFATGALGVLVHDSTINGDVLQVGGGGGVNCMPQGVFAAVMSPVYSDYEDNTIGGNLGVSGLQSCWIGALRDLVGGSVTFTNNTMADPDAMEVNTNQISGNMICAGNSPQTQYGDGFGQPNIVAGAAIGECSFTAQQPEPAASPGPPPVAAGPMTNISVQSTALQGYDMAGADGGVFSLGIGSPGSLAATHLNSPIVGMAEAPGGDYVWLVASDGGVFPLGPGGQYFGGLGGTHLNQPIVGIAAAPQGDGYYLVASDGGVFTFGPGATFYGSLGGVHLNSPIVAIAAAPGGAGYYLVAADGGVFTFGPGATFNGSLGSTRVAHPIVGIAVDPVTGGYWLVDSAGNVTAFNAPSYGSITGALSAPIVGIAAAPGGNGYYLVGADGGVFTFGPGAHYQGGFAGTHLNKPIVGIGLA